jgi:hypothetical protein
MSWARAARISSSITLYRSLWSSSLASVSVEAVSAEPARLTRRSHSPHETSMKGPRPLQQHRKRPGISSYSEARIDLLPHPRRQYGSLHEVQPPVLHTQDIKIELKLPEMPGNRLPHIAKGPHRLYLMHNHGPVSVLARAGGSCAHFIMIGFVVVDRVS